MPVERESVLLLLLMHVAGGCYYVHTVGHTESIRKVSCTLIDIYSRVSRRW